MKQEIKDKLDRWVSKEYRWLLKEIGTNITWGKMSEYTEDLLHHLILDLYKMDEEKIDGMLENGKLKYYLLSGASLQIRSKTSPFYHIHRKQKLSARSGIIDSNSGNVYDSGYEMSVYGEEPLSECFERAVAQLHWYDQTIFNKKFKEDLPLQEIHEYYSISKNHLVKDLNRVINEIRQTCVDAR